MLRCIGLDDRNRCEVYLRIGTLIVSACLCATASAQTPNLSRPQRELLGALVGAVDAAATVPGIDDASLRSHVLRASDGSHYVAWTVAPAQEQLPNGPVVLYVRLAAARAQGERSLPERSLVREWLLGSRVDPQLTARRRGFAVGDMPAMGAGTAGSRGVTSVGSADLQIMEMQRERARQRKADEEKQRRATLEGGGASAATVPFEDFDVVNPAAAPGGLRIIERALTAGPGVYELFVAWVDASRAVRAVQPHLVRRVLRLGPATSEFGLSSVIIAEQINVRATPFTALEQRAHPYSIGATEIVPAADSIFTPSDRLSVAFQIVNPMSSSSGHPDVQVNLRIVRMAGREEPVATLSPLVYNASTMPADFDLRIGHPLIAALSAPLMTIPRGQYRLLITAEDRIAGSVVGGSTEFSVVGTMSSLLAEAPQLGVRFESVEMLRGPVLNEILDRLTPIAPSAPLTTALRAARTGRFADLFVADAVPPAEQGVRTALGGMALLSLGNPSAITEFQRALVLQAPIAPVQFLLAASLASQGRDRDAIAAWEAARHAGLPPATVDLLIAEAYLRQKDYPRAATAIDAPAADDHPRLRTFAATRIATKREAEAIAALEGLLARDPRDQAARWLLLHALYAEIVANRRDRLERFVTEAPRYIDGKGEHATLAAEWLTEITKNK